MQRGVNLGEMLRKGGELKYKCSGINNSNREHKHNRELMHISPSIWSYLLNKQIAMPAEYLPSALNVHADWESRNAKDNSEWELDISVFQETVTWDNQLWICLDPDSATNVLDTLHGNQTQAV